MGGNVTPPVPEVFQSSGEDHFVRYPTYPHPPQPNAYCQWDNTTDVFGSLRGPCPQHLEPAMGQVYLPTKSRARRSVNTLRGSKFNKKAGRTNKRARAKEPKTPKSPSPPKEKPSVQIPHIEVPLSSKAKELAYAGETIDDIGAYVNRSAETRKQEARWLGKVKRELNPFFLYRKSYKNVAAKIIRERFDEDSHLSPRISSLCGHSWNNLEPPEVKDTFEKWSHTEKEKLKEAFPEYKYRPNRRASEEDKDKNEEEEDGEDEQPGFMAGPGMVEFGGDMRRTEPTVTPFSQDSLFQQGYNLWPYAYGYQMQPYEQLGSPNGESVPGSPSPDPFPANYSLSLHDIHNQSADPFIDPKLYSSSPPQGGLLDDSFGAMGQNRFSRDAFEGPIGQNWASSIPRSGADLHGGCMNEFVGMNLFAQSGQ